MMMVMMMMVVMMMIIIIIMYSRYDHIVVQNIAGKNYFPWNSLNTFHIKHL